MYPYEKGMLFHNRKNLYINIIFLTFCDKECNINYFVKRNNSKVICDCGKEYVEKA